MAIECVDCACGRGMLAGPTHGNSGGLNGLAEPGAVGEQNPARGMPARTGSGGIGNEAGTSRSRGSRGGRPLEGGSGSEGE